MLLFMILRPSASRSRIVIPTDGPFFSHDGPFPSHSSFPSALFTCTSSASLRRDDLKRSQRPNRRILDVCSSFLSFRCRASLAADRNDTRCRFRTPSQGQSDTSRYESAAAREDRKQPKDRGSVTIVFAVAPLLLCYATLSTFIPLRPTGIGATIFVVEQGTDSSVSSYQASLSQSSSPVSSLFPPFVPSPLSQPTPADSGADASLTSRLFAHISGNLLFKPPRSALPSGLLASRVVHEFSLSFRSPRSSIRCNTVLLSLRPRVKLRSTVKRNTQSSRKGCAPPERSKPSLS